MTFIKRVYANALHASSCSLRVHSDIRYLLSIAYDWFLKQYRIRSCFPTREMSSFNDKGIKIWALCLCRENNQIHRKNFPWWLHLPVTAAFLQNCMWTVPQCLILKTQKITAFVGLHSAGCWLKAPIKSKAMSYMSAFHSEVNYHLKTRDALR